MKLLRIVVEGLPLFQEKLDICFYAQQRVSEDQRDFLYPLFSTVFLNTTNVFAGIIKRPRARIMCVNLGMILI